MAGGADCSAVRSSLYRPVLASVGVSRVALGRGSRRGENAIGVCGDGLVFIVSAAGRGCVDDVLRGESDKGMRCETRRCSVGVIHIAEGRIYE